MPHADSLILTLVGGFVLAFVFGMLANRLKLSPLVGYLVAGSHFDTGVEGVCESCRLPGLEAEGIFTHFAVSDEADEESKAYTREQFRLFTSVIEKVEEKLGRSGYPAKQIEGYDTANWILLDFGDVIVHIFDRENRLLYDLERIWRDGKQTDVDQIRNA